MAAPTIPAVLSRWPRMNAARMAATIRDALFLLGLAVVFVFQLDEGISLNANPGNSGDVDTIAILVVCCFFIGIARAWELAGGPSIGITHEVTALVRDHNRGEEPEDEQPSAPPR